MGFKSFWSGLVEYCKRVRSLAGRNTALNLLTRTSTEGACEVVRVADIVPHGNADSLEVVLFDMATGRAGYEVVVRKGDYKVGDLAVYLSVDCIVPIKGPFAFLGERLDGKGKTSYRLRAARLRGRFSQGLLVQIKDLPWQHGYNVGDQCWGALEVTYYSPPEPGVSTPASTKKPKKQPMPVYGVDSLKKLPNLFGDQHQVFITEKIHGTNFRFGWVRRRLFGFIPAGYRFVVGSHRTIRGEGQEHAYYGEDLYTKFAAQNDLARRTSGHKGHVFYGELYGYTYDGKKIQDLTYTAGLRSSFEATQAITGPRLAVFDVLLPDGSWCCPRDRISLCASLGLPHVPVLPLGAAPAQRGEDSYWGFEAMSEGKSVIAPGQIREGIVVETIGVVPRRKAKYVSQAYLMRKDA